MTHLLVDDFSDLRKLSSFSDKVPVKLSHD